MWTTELSNPQAVRTLRFLDGEIAAVAGNVAIRVNAETGDETSSAVKMAGAQTQFMGRSDDGSRLVAASEDSDFVRLYDTSTGQQLQAIKLD